MITQKANINHEILRWARKEAGYSLERAAEAIGMADTRKMSAVERLAAWESGVEAISQAQLEKVSKAYFRPTLTFYMPTPPAPDNDVADFRTVGDHAVGKPSPQLRALVSRIKSRQQSIVDLLSDDEENPPRPLAFVGRFRDRRSVDETATDIEHELDQPLERRTNLNSKETLFRSLRRSAEAIGIFVLREGNLGSYHTNIDANEFRGFALADPIAPFVVVNTNDAVPAQTFSLIHELAHIWLGETGISNFNPFNNEGASGTDEAFCNNVAAQFLMPRSPLEEIWTARRSDNLLNSITATAQYFSVSRAAVAHRLWRLSIIEENQWWHVYNVCKAAWAESREKLKERQNGPTFSVTKRSQLGDRLITTVLGALDAGDLTYTRASKILRAPPSSFEDLRA